MRIDRALLIDLSLKTLAEQVELASAGAPPPSHGVRLALKNLMTARQHARKLEYEFQKGEQHDSDKSNSLKAG